MEPEDTVSIREINHSSSAELERVFAIYQEAIPVSEQKNFEAVQAMVLNPDYRFLVATNDRAIVGFAVAKALESKLSLLEYMAVDTKLRGGGVGGQLFEHVKGHIAGDAILLLEVDAVSGTDAGVAQRRRAFYERHGCRTVDGLEYILPLGRYPPPMRLMLFTHAMPEQVSWKTVRAWLTAIYTQVYAVAGDDLRIAEMLKGKHGHANII